MNSVRSAMTSTLFVVSMFGVASTAAAVCDETCQICLADCKSERNTCRNDAQRDYSQCIADCNQWPYTGCSSECGQQRTKDMDFCNTWALNCQSMCYEAAAGATLVQVDGQMKPVKAAAKNVTAKAVACRKAAAKKALECRTSCATTDGDCLKGCHQVQSDDRQSCQQEALFRQQELLLGAKTPSKK